MGRRTCDTSVTNFYICINFDNYKRNLKLECAILPLLNVNLFFVVLCSSSKDILLSNLAGSTNFDLSSKDASFSNFDLSSTKSILLSSFAGSLKDNLSSNFGGFDELWSFFKRCFLIDLWSFVERYSLVKLCRFVELCRFDEHWSFVERCTLTKLWSFDELWRVRRKMIFRRTLLVRRTLIFHRKMNSVKIDLSTNFGQKNQILAPTTISCTTGWSWSTRIARIILTLQRLNLNKA